MYADGGLSAEERGRVESHLAGCKECSEQSLGQRHMRSVLRSVPGRTAPPDLALRLRVLASHERQRRIERSSFAEVLKNWSSRVRLWADNLMRPLAIPTAGGFVSSFVLFSMLTPAFVIPGLATIGLNDVPTGLYTEASVKGLPLFGVNDDDIIVEVMFDEQGRVVDFTIPSSPRLLKTPGLRGRIESNLLFTQFTPATSFGQPKAGRIRVSFSVSRIEVKG